MKTEKDNSPIEPMKNIIYATLGVVAIVAGVTAIFRLSKIMISDFKELGF
jgi:hypothetical protein